LVPSKAKAHGRLAVHDERFPASVPYFPNHSDSSGQKIPEKQGFSMPVDKKMLDFQGETEGSGFGVRGSGESGKRRSLGGRYGCDHDIRNNIHALRPEP
jgi:hypothetical protein